MVCTVFPGASMTWYSTASLRPCRRHPLSCTAHRCATRGAVLHLEVGPVTQPIGRRRRKSPAHKEHSSQPASRPASRAFPFFFILRMIRPRLKHFAKFTFRCFRAQNRERDLRAGDESSPDGGVCVVTEHSQVPPDPLGLSQVTEERCHAQGLKWKYEMQNAVSQCGPDDTIPSCLCMSGNS